MLNIKKHEFLKRVSRWSPQLIIHCPTSSLSAVITIEEGPTCEHGENRAQLAQQKGKEPQGAYTCQRKKKVEATGVQMKEGTSKKKNKTEGQLS